ncbi:Butyryl-CoA dehydrogenase [Sphingobium chlorophenolicum L-1]|uniref:3-sulfinopropanoyl-CoA desulfinase n=1 Tax=Sphingobium chlorophenolicum L-1 TaxID=690566 RepID=F6EWB9_SPHCR|nr:acyl-CoA dehydrogenase family protein [Sphingobium chlorophenolicum]AEG49813.1 Butyryl-CoA dehydrogenase [Sphingobium chlorophenolicum L-1]
MTTAEITTRTNRLRRADSLFNEALLPDESRRIRREVRDFAEAVLKPEAFRLNTTPESREGFPRAMFEAMAAAGLYEIPFPADVGGRGLEFPTLATMIVLEELGYFSAGIASALFDAQALLVGQTLANAPKALRQRYLPRIVRGEIVGSFATSEPQASTDLSADALRTVATRTQGGWRINGKKRWISNAIAADFILTLCRTGEGEQTFILVETHQNGIEVGAPDLKMGNHPQLTSDVTYTGAFAAEDNVVGRVGGGLKAALSALMLGRIGIGAVGVGLAQAAFDEASAHMEERHAFGQPLGRFQHWQFTFADHAILLETARSLYLKAAQLHDIGIAADAEAAMAKVAGSRLAVDVARDAIQVCGAYGFARYIQGAGSERILEAIYRDAKIGEIYEGANEIQKWILARRIFGRHITG